MASFLPAAAPEPQPPPLVSVRLLDRPSASVDVLYQPDTALCSYFEPLIQRLHRRYGVEKTVIRSLLGRLQAEYVALEACRRIPFGPYVTRHLTRLVAGQASGCASQSIFLGLSGCSETQQRMFAWCYYGGYDSVQAAQALKLSPAAARSVLRRTLQRLRG